MNPLSIIKLPYKALQSCHNKGGSLFGKGTLNIIFSVTNSNLSSSILIVNKPWCSVEVASQHVKGELSTVAESKP